MTEIFDIVCIGGGPGGISTAIAASNNNKSLKIGIIEKSQLGGTCLNSGCIPKKIFYNAAKLRSSIKDSGLLGINCFSPSIDWDLIVKNKDQYISKVATNYALKLKQNNVHIIKANASITSLNTITLDDGTVIKANNIVVACGTNSIKPDKPGITSNDFFNLKKLPKSVLIIGSGYIGVELANIILDLESDVTMVIKGLDQLPLSDLFDQDIRKHLFNNILNKGVSINTNIECIEYNNNKYKVTLDGYIDEFDQVIWAIGRAPILSTIFKLGDVVVDSKGFIKTDDNYMTCFENIYAIGDVNGISPLAPSAIRQGRYVADIITGKIPKIKNIYTPTVLFFNPPVTQIGITESNAIKQGLDIDVYQTSFTPLQNFYKNNILKTFIKIICHNQIVIGFCMMGESADEISQLVAVCMENKLTINQIKQALCVHPTTSEEILCITKR